MIDWESSPLLTNLTHLDGRNSRKLSVLKPIFSEFAWIKIRLDIMISFIQHTAKSIRRNKLSTSEQKKFHTLVDTFSLTDAKEVTTIESRINHDIKAIELYLIERMKRIGLRRCAVYVNLGIGSEDINSIAIALQLIRSRGEIIIPALKHVIRALCALTQREKDTLMVARTHGQPANVTTLGKELAVPLSRLCDEVEIFRSIELQAKCSGEVGSYQAFLGVSRSIDWLSCTDAFIRSFGLVPTHATTQIAPYDSIIRYLQSLFRINGILIDCCRNMWLYVLLGYIKVTKIDKEVGSAGMPHKVNPIYFEGAEGGLEMADGVIETLVRKLPINRLQRDFSDSTVRRNIVLPLALSLLSYQSFVTACERITIDKDRVAADLDDHWEVWLETVKSYGISHGVGDMYDRLRRQTRGRILSRTELMTLIESLPLKELEKKELLAFCDGSHNPYPVRIVNDVVRRARRIRAL